MIKIACFLLASQICIALPNDIYCFVGGWEGNSEVMYIDSLGNQTIGRGLNMSDPVVKRVVEEKGAGEAFKFFVSKANENARNKVPQFSQLPKGAQWVLTDINYNLGQTKFGTFRKFIDAMNKKDFKRAAAELKDSKWYGQVGRRARHHVLLLESL